MKKMPKWLIVFLILCLIAAGVLYVLIYTIPEITGSRRSVAVIEYGEMRIAQETTALVVREERGIYADQSGTTGYYIDENTKTRKGTKVLDIYPANGSAHSYLTDITGVVSYYVDGYEEVFTPETIDAVDPGLFRQETAAPQSMRSEAVEAGSALYKLISSDQWYAVLCVEDGELWRYAEGASVSAEFPEGTMRMTVDRIVPKGGEALVVCTTAKYFEAYTRLRFTPVTVVTTDLKGLIVPNTAVAHKSGDPGVYVKTLDGGYRFTRIRIIASDGTNSVVAEGEFTETADDGTQQRITTVSSYDEILRNASEYQKR